ncbi:MAG: Lrp/AsnC family transcriptional regulator [Halieaceae bacterium]|jgi:siroheme decarboxylase|nr:Lrp/AsnC family transcriptional regulator [Halieaceae bacterium]
MAISTDQLIKTIQDGLPLCPRPYAQIAEQLEATEQEVIDAIADLVEDEVIKRLGVVVKHKKLGYVANAMVVWNVDDSIVHEIGDKLAAEPAVTLCYQRPRRLPHWPYNLFTMIHGKERQVVFGELQEIRQRLKLDCDFDVLFSSKCFKQRGARYF